MSKILRAELDEETHRRFKLHACGCGRTMASLVQEWVGEIVSTQSGVGESLPKASKSLSVGGSPVRGAEPKKVDAEVQGVARGRTVGATPATGATPIKVESPSFKVIKGLRFGSPEHGMLRENSVMCVECRQFCDGEEGWSKNGKDFVCGPCWEQAT